MDNRTCDCRLGFVPDTVGECATKHLTLSITNRPSKDFSFL